MGAFISSRLANPDEAMAVKKDSWGWALAVGVVALLVTLAVVAIGFLENKALMGG